MKRLSIFVAAGLLIATSASAQTTSNTWSRGTTLLGFAGVSATSDQTLAAAGTSLGWEINHAAELQGTASWLPERNGTQGFATELKLLFNLTRPAAIVPFVGGGAGLYRTTFDVARTSLPKFYERRGEPSASARATFTDPTIVASGGANIYVARHFSIMPAVDIRFVTRNRSAYTVTTATCGLVFHFENHERRGSVL